MDIASLIIGIVAGITLLMPCLTWFSIPLAIVGSVLGFIAYSKAQKENTPTNIAIGGIVLNIIVVVLAVIFSIICFLWGVGSILLL